MTADNAKMIETMLSQKPARNISLISIKTLLKTMALGGIATGNLNAQLAAIATGISTSIHRAKAISPGDQLRHRNSSSGSPVAAIEADHGILCDFLQETRIICGNLAKIVIAVADW